MNNGMSIKFSKLKTNRYKHYKPIFRIQITTSNDDFITELCADDESRR